MDAAFRAAEAHGIRAILGKVMMDRGTYDPIDRAVDDPRPIAARVGRPHRALARRRRRPARLRGHAPVRGLVHGRHAARVGGAGARRPGRGGRATCRRTRARSPRSRRLFPEARRLRRRLRPGRRASASGRSWPTRSTCPTASSAGSSRPARASRIARRRTCSSGPGSCRWRAGWRPALSIGLGIGRVGRAGRVDVLGHARRCVRPDGAPQRSPATRAPILDPLGWLRLGTLDGARALGLDDVDRLARGRQGGRPDRVDPALVAALPGRRRTTTRPTSSAG